MATNRKRRTIVEETLEPGEGTDAGGPNGVDVADIIVVSSKVYRLNGGTKSFVTVATEPVDEVFLQNSYPSGGKYQVQEFNSLGVLINTVNYDIEPKAMITSNGSHNGTNGSMSVQDVQIRMLFEELSHSRQMVMTLISQLASGNRGGSVTELVTALSGLHNIAGGNSMSKTDPVELLIKGMELGQNGGKVSPDWKGQLLDTVKEIAPSAIQAIAMTRNPQTPGDNKPMTMLAPTPEESAKANIQWIKQQILGGMNVDLAIGWLIQNARNPEYQPMLSLAIQGTIDNFIALDTEVGNEPYRTWFTNAITQLKEWYAEQQLPAEDDMDGGVRDDTDTKSHEIPSLRSTTKSKTL